MESVLNQSLTKLFKKSPTRTYPKSDLNLEYISGPVEWYGFEFEDKAFHFFCDIHFSKEEDCQSFGLKCSSISEPILDTNCQTIDALVENIMMFCEANKVHGDLFIEHYYQSKNIKESRKKTKAGGYLDDVIEYMIDYYEKTKDIPSKYTKQNYIDIRFASPDMVSEPFSVLVDIFESMYLISKNVKDINDSSLGDLLNEILLDIMNLIASGKFNYYKINFDKFISDITKELLKFKNKFSKTTFTTDDKSISDHFFDKIMSGLLDAQKFYKLKNNHLFSIYLSQLETLKKKNITFNGNNIGLMIENFIDDKITTAIQNINLSPTNVKSNIKFMRVLTLKISNFIMDGYTLSKMFSKIKEGPQIMITYAGKFHVLNYIEFFQELGLKALPATNNNLGKRCVYNKNFGKIFGKWMDLSLKNKKSVQHISFSEFIPVKDVYEEEEFIPVKDVYEEEFIPVKDIYDD